MWEHILLLRYALSLLRSGTQKIKHGDTCFVVALPLWTQVEVVLRTLRITVLEVEMAVKLGTRSSGDRAGGVQTTRL
jgi:hypothetical protein